MNHPEKQANVYYYYMPPQNERPAEIISILNANMRCIQVPVREEDLELYAIYKRRMTESEVARFGRSQTWRIFRSWLELVADHQELEVGQETIERLGELKVNFKLEEGAVV